jgi:hypothetical protein
MRYTALRPVLHRRAQAKMEIESWGKQADDLFISYLNATLTSDLPAIAALNATARAGLEEVQAVLEKAWEERTKALRKGKKEKEVAAPSGKKSRRPLTVSLDTQLLEAVLSPLAPDGSTSGTEKTEWLKLVGELLTLCLQGIPAPSSRCGGEVDGLPTEFDRWVFERVASLLPLLPAEDARPLWRPILDLGIPAHNWVEQFYWQWFTDGYSNAPAPEAFTAIWEEMIHYAAKHRKWASDRGTSSYDLAKMVTELLGFHFGTQTVATNTSYAEALAKMTPAFKEVSEKWFGMATVVGGFARFAVTPAATKILLPAIRWVSKASETVKETKSERNLDDALINLLREAWERHRGELAQDKGLMDSFQGLLKRLAARDSHAALALRDRVLGSLSSGG